jgi:hypothetical protein
MPYRFVSQDREERNNKCIGSLRQKSFNAGPGAKYVIASDKPWPRRRLPFAVDLSRSVRQFVGTPPIRVAAGSPPRYLLSQQWGETSSALPGRFKGQNPTAGRIGLRFHCKWFALAVILDHHQVAPVVAYVVNHRLGICRMRRK